jgi:spore coat polysaccharide biosynthesis protein SpsF
VSLAVIQARMGSSRLPGKVLRPLGSGTVLSWVVRAAHASGEVDEVVVATTTTPRDDDLAEAALALPCRVVRGPEEDVLQRYLLAVSEEPPGRTVVRLTADCPLLDPEVIAIAVRAFNGSGLDYLGTAHVRSLPRGLDVEVTSAGALRAIDGVAEAFERVHVTPRFYLHPDTYRIAGLVFAPDASDLRVTLDTPEDAELIEALVELLGDRPPHWRTLVRALRDRPDLVALNAAVQQKALEDG